MLLEKSDLKEIKKIVDNSIDTFGKSIKKDLSKEIVESKKEILEYLENAEG